MYTEVRDTLVGMYYHKLILEKISGTLHCMPNNKQDEALRETQWKSYLLDLKGSQNSHHPKTMRKRKRERQKNKNDCLWVSTEECLVGGELVHSQHYIKITSKVSVYKAVWIM